MKILTNPDPKLRVKAKKIEKVDKKLLGFAKELMADMLKNDGVGLAAVQVGESIQMIALNMEKKQDYPKDLKMPMVLINPSIIYASYEMAEGEEACLSLPGLIGPVWRSVEVTVAANDLDMNTLHIDATDWFARVLQHEIDHLNGVLFVDRIKDKKIIRKYDPKEVKIQNSKGKNVSKK
jgi:peptide deformylase